MIQYGTNKETRLDTIMKAILVSGRNSLVDDDLHIIQCNSCRPVPLYIDTKHVFQFLETECFPVDVNLGIAVGNLHTHPIHNIKLYGWVLYLC